MIDTSATPDAAPGPIEARLLEAEAKIKSWEPVMGELVSVAADAAVHNATIGTILRAVAVKLLGIMS